MATVPKATVPKATVPKATVPRAAVPKALNPYRRPAWRPRIQAGPGPRDHSKFGGRPWLQPGEPWPTCPNCTKPMQFLMQLDLNKIPKELQGDFGEGLLQVFYCTSEEPDCAVDTEAWFPFSQGNLARIVHRAEPKHGPDSGRDAEADLSSTDWEPKPFPEKVIVGWDELLDYPDPEEAEDMGVDLDDADWEALEKLEKKGISVPRDGDKLSGWPFWAQSVAYPDCPVCGGRMQFIFQIESEKNLPFSFGDGGCGYITQCEIHQDQVAFSWASA